MAGTAGPGNPPRRPLAGARDSWRFTGEFQGPPTGLYKIGLRYYQPELGRWTQRDPAERAANPVQPAEANPYVYVGAIRRTIRIRRVGGR